MICFEIFSNNFAVSWNHVSSLLPSFHLLQCYAMNIRGALNICDWCERVNQLTYLHIKCVWFFFFNNSDHTKKLQKKIALKLCVLCRSIKSAIVLDLTSEYCQFIPQCPRSFLSKCLIRLCSFMSGFWAFKWDYFPFARWPSSCIITALVCWFSFHLNIVCVDFVFRAFAPPFADKFIAWHFSCCYYLFRR